MDVLEALESTDDILTGIGIIFKGYTLNISETNNDMVRDFYTFHDSDNMNELTYSTMVYKPQLPCPFCR